MSTVVAGFIGVLLGASIGILKDLIAYWAGRRRRGRYAAVRIICVLDQYVEKCVEVVGDDGTAQGRPAGLTQHGEEYLEAQVTSPSPPIFPADIDWTSLNPDLMYRILALPNLALETDRFIFAASEHSFPPDFGEFFEARWEGYADLGVEALSIAEALRREFKLSKASIAIGNPDWDSGKFLRDKKADVLRRREAERAASAGMFESITAQNAIEK